MNKKIIAFLLGELFNKAVEYYNKHLAGKVKEALKKAFNNFKETLWNSIKDEVHACALEIVDDAKKFLESAEAKEKEEVILSAIVDRIKLPLVLKPFKGVIKKVIKNKLEDFLTSTLKQLEYKA